MLDSETKRRIDTCRDILVGKVPDPKSQVEQITIALIYKFMNDMDIEAEALGGHRKYFKGDFDKYAWAKLVASGMGGHEMLALYGEAITKMSENSGIPELFRDIFKNAYLPYRDPETLRSFLKEIDSFKYDHSERLGDAFEYLLSVLGSQGDAGQFRTPRHIIDFMVEIVNPQKGEVILDPACGTAGFLISAYKHILKHNSSDFKASKDKEAYDEKGVPVESLTLENPLRYKGDLLTPDERKKLAKDIKGYDISPDMVRLSLVNMYLHGFPEPDIIEYDTLTSEEKWNDYADIILANPPFMTPKGGIRPHKRFSVTASRSEVLFVDYIAEHLTPNGRAAIVVPEGIIFQSGGAYKQLREMLVKQSLIAVISLPAGVFNPYSGVKTSILVLDKRLAKKTNNILFVKVENDGFNLGAQRRPIDKNDLPATVKGLEKYIADLQNSKVFEPGRYKNFSVVGKDIIAEGGEFNLSGERYGLKEELLSAYPIKQLSELIETLTPPTKIQKSEFLVSGKFPIIDQSQEFISGYTNDPNALINPEKPYVIFGDHTCSVKLINSAFAQGADGIKILKTNSDLLPEYLYNFLLVNPIESDGYKRHFSKLKELKIPLPPIEVQREIVAEIESYQKIIDGAKQILSSYQPRIPLNPDWPIVELGDTCDFINGYAFKSGDMISQHQDGHLPVVKIGNVGRDGRIDYEGIQYHKMDNSLDRFTIRNEDILIAMTGATVGKVAVSDSNNLLLNQRVGLVRGKQGFIQKYLAFNLLSEQFYQYCQRTAGGGAQGNISSSDIQKYKIPMPDPDLQKAIVAEIEKEQSLVNGNKELIRLFEVKIQAAINRVWGEAE